MKPPEVAMVAASYEVGSPQRVYSLNTRVFMNIGCSVFVLGGALFFGFVTFAGLVLFVQHALPIDVKNVYHWVGSCLAAFAVLWLFLAVVKDARRCRFHYECECSDGFLQIQGKTMSRIRALKWENIQRVEARKVKKPPTNVYLVYDTQGNVYIIEHQLLWKRCAQELARRRGSAA